MVDQIMQAQAARNLLQNCAGLSAGDRVLIVVEAADAGHYSPHLGPIVAEAAQELGVYSESITVGFQQIVQSIDAGLERAMARADCTIFFARLGDQLRFCGLGENRRVVVSYVLDEHMLASNFGAAHHAAFEALKTCVDRAVGSARHIRVTCPSGTDFSGPGHSALLAQETDVAVTRFPLSVFAPVPADAFSGVIAQTAFLTGTCSRFYEPYGVALDGTLRINFANNHITGFEGSKRDVTAARSHYNGVAARFGLDAHYVHSWHAGIHPGCAYEMPAEANFERWCSGAFGNPRILHLHTCGDFAPGEISLNVFDPTIELDGIKVWEDGRFHPERLINGAEILATYPCAAATFENPSDAIGVKSRAALDAEIRVTS